MSYTLEDFAADCRGALRADPGAGGQEKVVGFVQKALKDDAFIAEHVTPDLPAERTILFEDPELGFCICAHNYKGAKQGVPHDHGKTWAIYGQAVGETEMTDWRIVSPADGDKPAQVELAKSYKLVPGNAHLYPAGAVHAPLRDGPTRLIRIEGSNCDNEIRTRIEPVE